jgi:hypothetical protein
VVVDDVVGCSDVVDGEVDEVVGRIDVVDEEVDEVVRRVEVVLDTGGVGIGVTVGVGNGVTVGVGKGVTVGVGKGVTVGVGKGVGVCAHTRPAMYDVPSVLRGILMHTTRKTTEYLLIIGLTCPLSLLIRLVR